MGWIKRNLFFVISGVVALVLLGGAGFFIYQGWSRNAEVSDKLDQLYAQLGELEKPGSIQPGNSKIDNIKLAAEQDQQLRGWINQAAARFRPIPPIPLGEVTSKTYSTALGSTIYQLQQAAKENTVSLPNQYNFSFQVQSSKLTISSGLNPLAQQLGEVKAIAGILFAARVNNVDGIQRVRVSDDDVAEGLQADYTDRHPITNELAVITPYVVTFRCFTPELGRVIAGFSTSTDPFIIKSVSVQPANGTASADGAIPNGGDGGMAAPWRRSPGGPQESPGQPGMPAAGKGGLPTILKQQLLRISLEVDIVKLLPK